MWRHPLSARVLRGCLVLVLLGLFCATGLPPALGAGHQPEQPASEKASPTSLDPADTDCRQLVDLLQQQKAMISRETGQLKREIAALRDDLTKPGLKEVFAGIGYIFGLFGVGLYIQSRRGPTRS